MAERIVIRHLAGSKVNQVEQFPADAAAELTIGREPGVEIQFDPLRDDAVSRRHASIAIEPGDPPRFRMTDLNSRNGTYLNGERIVGETELLPGDTIELGNGGPKFEFDLHPRPSNVFGRTRAVPAAIGATRVIDNAESELPPPTVVVQTVGRMAVEPPPRPGIGRNTLLHELSIQRQATRQIMIYAVIGVLVVIGAVGGILYHAHQKSIAEQNARIEEKAEIAKTAEQNVALANEKIEDQKIKIEQQSSVVGLTPQEIVTKFGDATVWIRVHWRLYDRVTGRPLFHKTISVKDKDGVNKLFPAYVRWKDKLVRWLTLDDDMHTNYPVGNCNCEVTGTGFVVDPQGLILTNKHIVAGWSINYNRFSYYEGGRGVIYDEVDPHANLATKLKLSRELNAPSHVFDVSSRSTEFKGLIGWMPEEGGPIFANSLPIVIDSNSHAFEGRNDELSVRFPGTRVDISARLVRASTDNDVALIKIDAFNTLATMDTLATDDNVTTGESVVVLGYPGASIENNAIFNTVEGSEVHHHKEVVPEPTVTPGVISLKGSPLTSEGSVTVVGNLGDAYQMTVPAGVGNSGGPVFNREGKVIGLYTWGSSHETQTFAVPIKYARTLRAPCQSKVAQSR